MDTKYFAVKLIPKRPTFPQDITPDERVIMQQHGLYWRGKMAEGKVLAFGPVMDPKGVYGLGIVVAGSADEVHRFMSNDPALSLNNYEFSEMLAVVKE